MRSICSGRRATTSVFALATFILPALEWAAPAGSVGTRGRSEVPQACDAPSLASRFPGTATGLVLSAPLYYSRVAVGRDIVVVVGNAVPYPGTNPQMPPFRGFTLDAQGVLRELPPPSTSRTLYRPLAAVDDKGVIHLMWADWWSPPADTAPPKHATGDVNALWYAQYRDGRWSEPERVLAGTYVLWGDASHLTVTPDGGVLLLFASAPPPSPIPRLSIARRSLRGAVTEWQVGHAPPRGWNTSYAEGVLMPNGDVVVGFAGAGSTPGVRGQVVHATVARAGEATWQKPLLVRGGDSTQSFKVHLVHTPSGLHLFWAQSTIAGARPEVIEHAESRDGGATWARLPSVLHPGMFLHDFYPAVDACGRIYVVLNASATGKGEPTTMVSTLEDGRWTPADTLTAEGAWITHSVHVAAGPYAGAIAVATIEGPGGSASARRTVLWSLPRPTLTR